MKIMALLFILLSSGAALQDRGAKSLFYDPADAQIGAGIDPHPAADLRPITPVAGPFPPFGHVGLHYWLDAPDGSRLVKSSGKHQDARLSLHLRSNTDGFLTVWSKSSGMQLTPMDGPWFGYRLRAGNDYVLPGTFRSATSNSEGLFVLFARSQTEQVRSVEAASAKIRRIAESVAADGMPLLVKESDDTTIGQIGTYVVHRRGLQPGAEIGVVPE